MCASPCMPVVVLYTVLFKVLYHKIKNIFFIFYVCLFLRMYYLCEKYYKPITVQYYQYYIVDCVSWVPRLTLLDLQTNWTYKCTLRMELVHMQGTYCNPKSMGSSKSTSKREVYSDTSLPQETRKISNKLFNLTPKGTRKRRKNKTQSQQKERNHKDESGNK